MNLNLNLKWYLLGGVIGACATGALSAWFHRDALRVEYIGDAAKTDHLYCHRKPDGVFECAELEKFLRFMAGQQSDMGEGSL